MNNFNIEDFLLIQKIDSIGELKGIPIYATDERSMQCRVIRKENQSYTNNIMLIVEITILRGIRDKIFDGIKETVKPYFNQNTGALKPLYGEFISMGLNCGATISSAGVVAGSAVAGPETLGSTWIITAASWTSMLTSAALCGDSAGRFGIAFKDKLKHKEVREEIEELTLLDGSSEYKTAKNSVEALDLALSFRSLAKLGLKSSLRSSYNELKYIRTLKGSKRLEPLRKELEQFKFIHTKNYSDTASGIFAKSRKGVGNSEMNKLIRIRKNELNQLSFKNTLKGFVNDVKDVVINKIKEKTPDFIGNTYNYLREETVVVNFHFVEIN